MSRLSPHFTITEFVKSQTAERKGIENMPGDKHVVAMIALCKNVLEPIREHFDKPIMINSGYRSAALCRAIGSKSTSQHCKGMASDLEIFGIPNIQVAYWIQANCDFDQLILEFYKKDDPAGGWVHVSYNEKGANRKQVLTYDGKSYENGLPDMEWKGGKVVG